MHIRRRPGAASAVALVVFAGAAALAVAGPPAGAQSGFDQIHSYRVDVSIRADGSLHVVERIEYDFGTVPGHGILRDIPERFDYPPKADTDRVTPVSVRSVVGSAGTPTQYDESTYRSGSIGYRRLKIGDPDRTIVGVHTYTITYDVRGALNGFRDHDELVWNAIGGNWSVPVEGIAVTVHTPDAIERVLCSQGPYGSTLPCDTAGSQGSVATFGHARLLPNESLTVSISLPKGAVARPRPILEERWTLARAFTVNVPTVGGMVLLGVVLLGGYLWVFSRSARDRRFRGSPVDQAFGAPGAAEERVPLLARREDPVEFVPPDGIRPGQVGTLVDFTAHPLDVTATIVDLAVRKYVVIEEVPRPDGHRSHDWRLTRLEPPAGDLLPYEQETIDALFRDGGEVRLSELRYEFAPRMTKIEQALVDDAMARTWFTRRPDRARLSAGCLGIVGLLGGIGVLVALAAFTHAGLLGIPFVLLGIVMLGTAPLAPARTAIGSAALRRVHGFRRFIEESEKERARFAERANLFSEYLPYAIVFGATEQWARAFAGLGAVPPDTSWYRSTAPFDFLLFSAALTDFSVASAGTLVSTPPATSGTSGFSGGGFSGGGFGGGGGGRW